MATAERKGDRRARILALIGAAGIALAGVASGPASAGPQAEIDVADYRFSPPHLVVEPGTEVVWTSSLGDHTITSDGGSFDQLIVSDGQPHSFRFTFTEPGRYAYHCEYHRAGQGMVGTVEVRAPAHESTTSEPPAKPSTWHRDSVPPDETSTTRTAPATTTSDAAAASLRSPEQSGPHSAAPEPGPGSGPVPAPTGAPSGKPLHRPDSGAPASTAPPALVAAAVPAGGPAVLVAGSPVARDTAPAPSPAAAEPPRRGASQEATGPRPTAQDEGLSLGVLAAIAFGSLGFGAATALGRHR